MELNERVAKVEQQFESALPNLATKTDLLATKVDLQTAVSGVIKWVAGTGIGIVAIMISVMTFMFNQSAPRSAPAPIVLSVPQQPGLTKDDVAALVKELARSQQTDAEAPRKPPA